MGELGSGNGSAYPGALDTNAVSEVDDPDANATKARADVPNDLMAAVIALETELGVDPAGDFSTIVARLNVMPSGIETVTSATHTASTKGTILCDCSSNAITLTLPAVSNTGHQYHIKKIDTTANLLTIDGASSEQIENETSIYLQSPVGGSIYPAVTLISDGTMWHIIGVV